MRREYGDLAYEEACRQAVRIVADGFGEAVLLREPSGYWVLYYFSWSQAPLPTALPHWLEGPLADATKVRPPYEMKTWLEQMGYEEYLNDVD